MYRSEVRHSDISALEERVSKGGYDKYLRRVVLSKVRSFQDREVTFDFPVTAIVGPNGGGKTTVLGAAAIIYRAVLPGRFFSKSGKYDQSMRNWRIEYDIIDRTLQRVSVQRTASFKQLKWNRDAMWRDVHVFGVTRTVPASERRELVKAIGSKFAAKEEIELSDPVVKAVEAILGKSMAGYSRLSVDQKGKVTLYSASTASGTYSEFHFGAGEASIIRMVSGIEDAADDSLILIEEIENGLHPVAARRMVEYLIGVARRKSIQVIFTTHSNDALDPLPPKAIWAAYEGEVLQGKLDVRALRTITGQVEASLAIYVEDSFAELMVMAALRTVEGIELDAIKLHNMGGEAAALQVNKQRNNDPAATFPSICILDGDQRRSEDPEKRVFCLPGDTYPESYVYDLVLDKLDVVAARLAVMLGLRVEQQDHMKETIKSRGLTNQDRHNIFEQIGADLSFTAGLIVKTAFINIWTQETEDTTELTGKFIELLPITNRDNATDD